MPANYFIDGIPLGGHITPPMWDDATPDHASQHLFCPTCGSVWGRVINPLAAEHHPVIRRCVKHGDGSFIAPWRKTFDELPPEVLKREFIIRFERLTNGTNQQP